VKRGGRGRACAAVLLLWSAGPLHGTAAAHAQVGTPVPDLELATAHGGRAQLLGEGVLDVLVFFRAPHERSALALAELARCRQPLADKPARWVAVVPGSADVVRAQAMARQARLGVPVLVDEDDALHARLGVIQHPAVAIITKDRKLAAYEPYRSIDYCARVTARLRHALGELNDAELRSVLSPPRAVEGGDQQVARRYLALAQRLYRMGKYEKSLDSVRRSLGLDPGHAPAHALHGSILAAQRDCRGAAEAFRKALSIDPLNAPARQGLQRCGAQ